MELFNRVRARDYALTWALKRNPAFPDYSLSRGGGGDCTNFVSQTLMAGGWTVHLSPGPHGWWASLGHSSWAWATAEGLRQFLGLSGRAERCAAGDLAWGDVVFIVPRSLGDDNAAHAMVVTRVGRRSSPWDDVCVCGHSNDRRDLPLRMVDGEQNLEFWHVASLLPRSKLEKAYNLAMFYQTFRYVQIIESV